MNNVLQVGQFEGRQRIVLYLFPMTMWLPKLESRRGPVYRAIADALDEDVQNGALRAGMRLPPHRDLADHLGVTVTTITRAYAEAARRGLTSGHVGRGTFIRGNEAEERGSETTPFDLSVNILMPDKEVANLQPRLFQRRVLPWTQILGYIPAKGHVRHRQAMAAWLARGGLAGRSGSPRAHRRGPARARRDHVRAAQAERHAADGGVDVFRRTGARAPAASEDSCGGDGCRRPAP